jgi:hypothetical protein
MVRVELTPLSKSLRGSWKETSRKCLRLLRQCIYMDKDLVLPPTGNSGHAETFFVVASTDLVKVSILMDRIRDQVGALLKRKASGSLNVTAEVIPRPSAADPTTLEQQVWAVADYVEKIVQQSLMSKPNLTEKENHKNAH